MARISGFFCDSIAVDLGTVNTLAAVAGKGIVYREPTATAISGGKESSIVALGKDAAELLGRTPGEVLLEYPMKEGVVTDTHLAAALLRHVFRKSLGRRLPGAGIRAVLALPSGTTEVERQALYDAVREAGAREVSLLEEGFAAALGAGLPVYEEKGCMVVDIGGGTASSAVIALGNPVVKRSVRCGGKHLDLAIREYLEGRYGIAVSPVMAEEAKLSIASALTLQNRSFTLQGRDIKNGMPRSHKLFSAEVQEAIRVPLGQILAMVKNTLQNIPPELCGDVLEYGILLTGGGAKLSGLAECIERMTRIRIRVAEDPEDAVLRGLLFAAEHFSLVFGQKHGRNAV